MREKPVEDCLAVLEQEPDDRERHNEGDYDAKLLQPCRNCRQEKAHDVRYSARKRGLDSDRIERGVVRLLQCRQRGARTGDDLRICADHIIQRNRSNYRGAVRETCIDLLNSPPIGPFNCPCSLREAAGNP